MPRRIIIDTDPGQDDAVAILLALASPELEVMAITTVAGNVPQPLVTDNALKIVELAGRGHVPVHRGCERPLLRPLYTAEYVHGPSGIDGADLPDASWPPSPGHGVDVIVEACMASVDDPITLCPIGPLTNVATALVKQPAIVAGIAEIVLMGGGFFEGGNTTPTAEFNIYVDPHAAAIVFDAGVPITMMPLDVTHQALVTPEHIGRFRDLRTPVGDAVAGMLGFYERHDVEKYGIGGAPLHDPCVIAYLIEPDLFSGRRCHVAVETASELTMGMTVVDWWAVGDREPNALVMNEVDADRFLDLVVERLATL